MPKLLFLVGGVALVGTYFGYPLLLVAWRGLRRWVYGRADPRARTLSDGALPSASVVISAYNEEDVIAGKVRNSLSQDYPEDRLDVLVASDASNDGTDEIVRSFDDPRVKLLRVEGRKGKTACQNRAVEEAAGEILVFTDADSELNALAVRRLAERLSVSGVGCVSGDLNYHDEEATGEGVYWRYERWLKRLEADTGGMIGANGALYALRREDYVPLPADAISDFMEPLALSVEGRGRTDFSSEATAREGSEPSVWDEGSRRVRIVRRTVSNLWDLLLGRRLGTASLFQRPDLLFKIVVHKVVRWFSLLFVALFLVGAFGSGNAILNWAGVLSVAAALVSWTVIGIEELAGAQLPGVLKAPGYFLYSGHCMLRGVLLALFRGGQTVWDTGGRR